MNEKIGVIISLENYQSNEFGLSNVKYATNDSEAMKKIFIEVLGIEESNIYYFKDEQFTCMVGRAELQYYLKQMSNDAEIYLYYVGHGFFCEGKNYLMIISLSMRSKENFSIFIAKISFGPISLPVTIFGVSEIKCLT